VLGKRSKQAPQVVPKKKQAPKVVAYVALLVFGLGKQTILDGVMHHVSILKSSEMIIFFVLVLIISL
jgi:hypothetical protein